MSTKIKNLKARALIDCKGKPLLEVDLVTEDGAESLSKFPRDLFEI